MGTTVAPTPQWGITGPPRASRHCSSSIGVFDLRVVFFIVRINAPDGIPLTRRGARIQAIPDRGRHHPSPRRSDAIRDFRREANPVPLLTSTSQ
jgi:hypothetical protein